MDDGVDRRLERLEEAFAHLQLLVGELDGALQANTRENLQMADRLSRLERAVRQLTEPPEDEPPVPSWVESGSSGGDGESGR